MTSAGVDEIERIGGFEFQLPDGAKETPKPSSQLSALSPYNNTGSCVPHSLGAEFDLESTGEIGR